jgi:hypothetical protein
MRFGAEGGERSARSDDALHGAGADAELTANLKIAVALLTELLDAFLYLGIDAGPAKRKRRRKNI